jgi:methionine synthase I (cobalamin-dependent)
MAESGIPYIISFMIRKDGCLIDGISIADAIEIIDAKVNPRPLCYLSNCVHPRNLKLALAVSNNQNAPHLKRFAGIQANASSLNPEELNNCGVLHSEDYEEMISEMMDLKENHHFKIMGGCCGTNDLFIDNLAMRMSENATAKVN